MGNEHVRCTLLILLTHLACEMDQGRRWRCPNWLPLKARALDFEFKDNPIIASASIMCQVTSFFCGCVDLRKGALIIGITKLVTIMMLITIMRVMIMYQFGNSGSMNWYDDHDNHEDDTENNFGNNFETIMRIFQLFDDPHYASLGSGAATSGLHWISPEWLDRCPFVPQPQPYMIFVIFSPQTKLWAQFFST